jgi:hypothetical protein
MRNSSFGYVSAFIASDGTQRNVPSGSGHWEASFIAPKGFAVLGFIFNKTEAGANIPNGTLYHLENISLKAKKKGVSDVFGQYRTSADARMTVIETQVAETSMHTAEIDISAYEAKAVKVADGTLDTVSGYSCSNYIATLGAKYIKVLVPMWGTMVWGIAFYRRQNFGSFVSGESYVTNSKVVDSIWKTYEVPEGANYIRVTIKNGVNAKYQLFSTSADILNDVWRDAVSDAIGTQILRSAVPVSEKRFKYAFGMSQMYIINDKAYVGYAGNEHTVDGDQVGYPNEGVVAEVDLFDLSHRNITPVRNSTSYADSTPAIPTAIGYTTLTPTPNGKVARLALMRFGDNNPYFCYAISNADDHVCDYVTCKLQYTADNVDYDVDFTLNNYRQMIYRLGYADSYIASAYDYCANINLHYDAATGKYYILQCTSLNNVTLPLVLLESEDMASWYPVAKVGDDCAEEIAAIYRNGILYASYRCAENSGRGMRYLVYDVANDAELSSGQFPGTGDVYSKPDCFTFGYGVYMAVNVDPTVFGPLLYPMSYTTDARQEIVIYKVVGGVPKYFRRLCNPTGINYFSFMESNPIYAQQSSTVPMYAQSSIYIGFSEDRRHIYRRQIAQMSFADVTALFADNGRVI